MFQLLVLRCHISSSGVLDNVAGGGGGGGGGVRALSITFYSLYS